jgi:hypothetical protein
MALGTPYLIGTTATPSTSETQIIDVSTPTSAGDSILVATGSSATAATVTGIIDSAGNIYVAAIAAVTSDEQGQVWIAAYGSGGPGTPTAALTTSNTITATYGSVSGEKALVAVGISGLSAGGGAVDNAATSAKGSSSTAVSVASGTLTFAKEVALAVIFNAEGGGAPTSVTGSWNLIESYQSGTSPYVSCYYQDTSATTALSLAATLLSTTWSAFIIPLRGPVYLANSFEGGTNGTAVSAATSGGNSGNALDVVTTAGGATINYSNAEAAHGSLSGEFTEPSTTQQCFVEWTTSLLGTASGLNQIWFRAYCYFAAFPEASIRLISALSSSAFCGGVSISSTTGKFSLVNAAGTAQTLTNGLTTSTNAMPTGAWFRFEGYIIGSATAGQVVLSMYETMDSTVATESEATAATLNTTGVLNAIRFGDPSDGISFSFWLDDLGSSDTGYLGPALLSASSAIAGTGAATDLGDKTGTGLSSLAGTGALAGLGIKDALAAAALSGTGLLAGAGAKRGVGPSLVTATGVLASAFVIPVPSAISATAALAGTGLKTGKGVSAISATGGLKAATPSHPPVSAAFTTGYPRSRWNAGSPQTRWQAGYPLMRWPAGQ